MQTLGEWGRRLWYLLNRRRFEEALRREMDAHRELLERPARFGNTLRLREEARDAWGWRWLDELGQDVRLSARTLRRSPIFTATSLLILSLSVGVNLALFQCINAALIRPPRLKDPATLVRFDHRGPTFMSSNLPYPMAAFVEANNAVLSAVLVRHGTGVAWGEGGTQRARASFVSTNWFQELGATAAMGRLLDATDAAAGANPVVVLSHDFWQRQLGGRPDVISRSLRINDRQATVVGIAAADFPDVDFDARAIWMPLSQVAQFVPGSRFADNWDQRVDLFARLRPGVSLEAATTSLQSTLGALRELQPARVTAGEWLEPSPGTRRFMNAGEARQVWSAVLAVTALGLLVLMIGCFNLSNLSLGRAIARLREMSIRAGLGAGRWRIVRHLLAESGVLAALGGVGGLVLGWIVVRALQSVNPDFARLDVAPDWRLGLAMLTAALISTAAVGLAPAWRIGRLDLARATRDGGERVSQGLHGTRWRHGLVAAQIAGSCLLLVFAAQLARSLQRALASDLGFEFANVAVLNPSLNAHGADASAAAAYWRQVRSAIQAQPETAATALASYAPLGSASSTSGYAVAPHLRITVMNVEPSFFPLMDIPILAGRPFEPHDDPDAVVIISRRVAVEMYGTDEAVGERFPKGDGDRRIVGIAGDAHVIDLRAMDAGEQYMPLREDSAGASLLVLARADPERLLGPLRQAALAADPRIFPEIRLLRDDFDRALEGPRLTSSIAGGVSLLALGLAALGIFGVVSHAAHVRTKEIGIRLALGAARGAIVRLLLQPTMWAGVFGLGAGLAGAMALTRAFAGRPFQVDSSDPAAYLMAVAVFAMAGGLAAVWPALRTLRADPLQALRQE